MTKKKLAKGKAFIYLTTSRHVYKCQLLIKTFLTGFARLSGDCVLISIMVPAVRPK